MSPLGTTARDPSVLVLEGELTIYRVAELLPQFRDHLKDGRALELDLAEVTEIDGAGLQLLLWARSVADANAADWRVRACSPPVADAIGLLQLQQTLGLGQPDLGPGGQA